MPPKRRGTQAKSAPPTKPVSKPTGTAPVPPPLPLPLPPPESDAEKVRKEWSKFIDAWYDPQKKKLVEKLQKDILAKYKHLGSPKDTQKLREMELFEKLDSLAQQLAQPARAEWERRLDLAQLREDQWDDMSGEEQQAVMSVFVGFIDDVEDMQDDDLSPEPYAIEEEESVVDEPLYRPVPTYPPVPSRQPIPPTPTRHTFECVNPTAFFVDNMTPPNPSKNLPALSMDHLATLGPSNAGRSAEPASVSVNGMPGFHTWASEAGILTQQPQPPLAKPLVPSTSAQSQSARPRATDNISRQASAASFLSSPPSKASSPPYSPPNPTTKFSPPINADNLPLGKRYIGPVVLEEPDPLDEDLLKSKMTDEYQQYKISLRIQMIYQFHAEAAQIEIKLLETLLADEGTKESRARAVQEHETSMMRLREQKEEERKRLCAEEREKRREEMRQHLALRRSGQNREVDPSARTNPSKSVLDKTSAQQRPIKVTHQKENVPLSQPATASSSKLDPPSILKKSNSSTLSQEEASANEAFFANAKAMMAQGKAGAAVLTPGQASLNEALFSNPAAMLATQGQPGGSGKNTVPPPSIMKKSNSSRSQDYDVPQITVSFADPPTPAAAAPELAQVLPTTIKGKKGKKAQLAPSKPVAITEEPEMETDAEPPPPPPAPSLLDAATVVAKSVWGVASASISTSKPKLSATAAEEERGPPTTAPAPSKGNANAKKTVLGAKKGKKVTITEESDVDADPIAAPPAPSSVKTTSARGAWGTANGKSKAASSPGVAEEESGAEPPAPLARGKKAVDAAAKSAAQKPQLRVTISDALESESELSAAPARTTKDKARAKSAWDVTDTGISAQAGKRAMQQPQPQQAESRHGGARGPGPSEFVRMDNVPDPEDRWAEVTAAGEGTMPGALASAGLEAAKEGVDEDEDEADASAWFNPENMIYWANLMAGSSEAEKETLAVPAGATEPMTTTTIESKHVRWTPTVSGESDDEGDGFGDADEVLATSMWMQYAISGGGMPALGDAPEEEPHRVPSESAQRCDDVANVWELGRGSKKMQPTAGEVGNRAQQTSVVFDRAAFAGQWPKMESWLSPPSRGQNSGSTRVF